MFINMASTFSFGCVSPSEHLHSMDVRYDWVSPCVFIGIHCDCIGIFNTFFNSTCTIVFLLECVPHVVIVITLSYWKGCMHLCNMVTVCLCVFL